MTSPYFSEGTYLVAPLPPAVSVCICTYNRADLLKHTLETLAAQEQVDWTRIEVIVVDNNCTDDTPAVLDRFADKLPLRRVVETAQGLSNARNRAMAEARGEWTLFTDDDVLLDASWLAAYQAAFERYPEADFAGGRIEPDWRHGAPNWYRGDRLQLLDGVLVRCDKGETTRFLGDCETLFLGASFALRANLTDRVGAFRADLGVSGKKLGRGEETDFMLRAKKMGANGLYVADSRCRHPVDPRRLTLLALFRYGVVSGEAHRAISDKEASGSLAHMLGFLVRGFYQLVKGRGDRFRDCVINAGVQKGLLMSPPQPSKQFEE